MNHLVFLDAQAGELEKILSGIKTMVVKEFDPAQSSASHMSPGDRLYFLRDKEEDCALRVQATVVHVFPLVNSSEEDLCQALKEMQPKLQLTESQYNDWSAKKQVLVVEFGSAHKINVIQVESKKVTDRSGWIAFEELGLIT